MGFKKVVATALATVTALSSIAVVSAGAYEWSAKSDDGDGKYIMGSRCSKTTGWNSKNVSRAKGCYWDTLTLNKNDQTTVRYLSNDNRIKWKVQAGSWSNKGVYCDVMKDDKATGVNVWAPQYNTVYVLSTAVDYNGKRYSQSRNNGYSTQVKSRAEVTDWFQSLKTGLFTAKYSTKGFELTGSIR